MAKPKAKASPKRAAAKTPPAKLAPTEAGVVKARVAKPGSAKSAPAKRSPAKRAAAVLPDDRLERLWTAIQQVREGRRDSPRTARLLAAGPPKLAQKVVEEAAEVAIEAVTGQRDALVSESVDLLYNLVALWNGLGVQLPAIWAEMDRREAALGMVEKLPKTDDM